MKIAWVCDKCNWLTVSDSKEHHKMDFCKCKDQHGGVDLEEYGCRYSGLDGSWPRIIAELKDGKEWEVKIRTRKKK